MLLTLAYGWPMLATTSILSRFLASRSGAPERRCLRQLLVAGEYTGCGSGDCRADCPRPPFAADYGGVIRMRVTRSKHGFVIVNCMQTWLENKIAFAIAFVAQQ